MPTTGATRMSLVGAMPQYVALVPSTADCSNATAAASVLLSVSSADGSVQGMALAAGRYQLCGAVAAAVAGSFIVKSTGISLTVQEDVLSLVANGINSSLVNLPLASGNTLEYVVRPEAAGASGTLLAVVRDVYSCDRLLPSNQTLMEKASAVVLEPASGAAASTVPGRFRVTQVGMDNLSSILPVGNYHVCFFKSNSTPGTDTGLSLRLQSYLTVLIVNRIPMVPHGDAAGLVAVAPYRKGNTLRVYAGGQAGGAGYAPAPLGDHFALVPVTAVCELTLGWDLGGALLTAEADGSLTGNGSDVFSLVAEGASQLAPYQLCWRRLNGSSNAFAGTGFSIVFQPSVLGVWVSDWAALPPDGLHAVMEPARLGVAASLNGSLPDHHPALPPNLPPPPALATA